MNNDSGERELIERARTDKEAFGIVFEKYYDALFSYALRRTGDVAQAEDVVAETFLKAFSKLWQFKWQGVPFSAWLYRIAGNEINMSFRKKKGRTHSLEAMIEEDASLDPADPFDLEAELKEAEEAFAREKVAKEAAGLIQSLPALYGEVLALRYFEEKSIAQIAEVLGKPEGTVKSLISRGVSKLRIMFEAQPGGGGGILPNEEKGL